MTIKELVKAARKAGWDVRQSRRNSHWRFTPPNPDHPPIFTAATPSDARAVKNAAAILRRAGLDI